jgi:hypothetical protein
MLRIGLLTLVLMVSMSQFGCQPTKHTKASYCAVVSVYDAAEDFFVAQMDEFAVARGLRIDKSHPLVRRYLSDNGFLIEVYSGAGRFGPVVAFFSLEKDAGRETLQKLTSFMSTTIAKQSRVTLCSKIPDFGAPEIWR